MSMTAQLVPPDSVRVVASGSRIAVRALARVLGPAGVLPHPASTATSTAASRTTRGDLTRLALALLPDTAPAPAPDAALAPAPDAALAPAPDAALAPAPDAAPAPGAAPAAGRSLAVMMNPSP